MKLVDEIPIYFKEEEAEGYPQNIRLEIKG
jgi:hypothetical protein